MESSKGTYIKTNKLYGMKEGSTTLSAAKAVYVGGTLSKRAYKGGTLVYDVWDTLLSADNFNMPAIGGDIRYALTVTSTMTSVDGTVEDLEYTLSRTEIPANTSTTSKTYTITITQIATGKSIDVICTQAATVQTNVTYGTPSVTSATANQVMASGGSSRLIIAYTQTKTTTYSNGETETETISGSATATSISGNEQNDSGAYISSNTISVPSAGTNEYYGNRVVFNITGYTFSANGRSKTVSNADIDVEQLENTPTESYGSYVITCNTSTSSVPAASSTFKVTAGCYRPKYVTWDSGAESEETEYAKVTMSGLYCSCSPASFTSSASSPTTEVTVTTEENTDDSTRKCTVYATAPDNTKKAVSVTQNAVAYEFTALSPNPFNLAYNATSMMLAVKSTKNGEPQLIYTSNIVVSDIGSVESIVAADSASGIYNINLKTNTNTGAERSFTVTITQPGSGAKITYTVNQAAANSDAPEGISVLGRSGDWFIGTVFTGNYAGEGSAQIPLYSLIVAKNSEITAAATAVYNLSYITMTPASSTPSEPTVLDTTKSIAIGSTVNVSGVTYNGIAILTSQPGLGVTLISFTVR